MNPQPLTDRPASDAQKGQRMVDYATEGRHMADIYEGEKLLPGMQFTGPAIIESSGTTTVIHPGNQVSVDGLGNIHIELQQGGKA